MNRKEKRAKKEEINILKDLIIVINQYFPELINKFDGLTDLRHHKIYRTKETDRICIYNRFTNNK